MKHNHLSRADTIGNLSDEHMLELDYELGRVVEDIGSEAARFALGEHQDGGSGREQQKGILAEAATDPELY